MDAVSRTTLDLRLAHACRIEHHALPVLEAIAANRELPRALRDRAELHHVETQAQLSQAFAALAGLAPSLAERLRAVPHMSAGDHPGVVQWMALERREINAYQGVLACCTRGSGGNLAHTCASAIDLQRAVLLWLEAVGGTDPESGWQAGVPGKLRLVGWAAGGAPR
jgi:hypothetical protein